jgi:transcriptional regulator with XRE-family HTH domain
VPAQVTPTLRRWDLGTRLRQLRQDRDLTIEKVSADLSEQYSGFSSAKISRMETGKRGVNPRDVKDLCDYYRVGAAETATLMQMARDSRGQDWWAGYSSIGDRYSTFIALESVAHTMRNYEASYIPGLLQTRAYAQAIVAGMLPDEPANETAAFVEVRLSRQERLTGPGALELFAILDESVLYKKVGSPEIVRAQLKHLYEISKQPNVKLQIVPADRGVYPGSETSNFVLLEFEDELSMPDEVCYVESFLSNIFIERPVDLQRASRTFKNLQDVALSYEDTRSLIMRTMEAS